MHCEGIWIGKKAAELIETLIGRTAGRDLMVLGLMNAKTLATVMVVIVRISLVVTLTSKTVGADLHLLQQLQLHLHCWIQAVARILADLGTLPLLQLWSWRKLFRALPVLVHQCQELPAQTAATNEDQSAQVFEVLVRAIVQVP